MVTASEYFGGLDSLSFFVDDPLLAVAAEEHPLSRYLTLTGASGEYASSPDSAALSITGDIDVRVKVAMDDWTPATVSTLVAKWLTGTNLSYQMRVEVDGTLSFRWSASGTAQAGTVTSTVATGLTDGTWKWVRVTLDVNNGAAGKTAKFYLSDDGSTWTQLGTTVTTAGTTSIFDGTSQLNVGARDDGVNNLAAGKFYRVQIRSNINDDGTGIVYDARFDTVSTLAVRLPTTFTEGSTNAAVVTVNGSAWSWNPASPIQETDTGIAGTPAVVVAGSLASETDTGVVGTPIVLVAGSQASSANTGVAGAPAVVTFPTQSLTLTGTTGNYASLPDSAALSITSDIDIRAYVAATDWTPAVIMTVLAKWLITGNQRSFLFQIDTTGTLVLITSQAGTAVTFTTISSASCGFTDGTGHWIRATWKNSTDTVQFFTSNDSYTSTSPTWTQLGTNQTGSATGIFDSTALLEIGSRDTGSATAPYIGKVIRAQVRNNVLDDGTGIQLDAKFYNVEVTGTRTPTTFTEGSSNAATVTVNGSAWSWTAQPIAVETDTGVAGAIAVAKPGALATETDTGVAGVAVVKTQGVLATETDTGVAGSIAEVKVGVVASTRDSLHDYLTLTQEVSEPGFGSFSGSGYIIDGESTVSSFRGTQSLSFAVSGSGFASAYSSTVALSEGDWVKVVGWGRSGGSSHSGNVSAGLAKSTNVDIDASFTQTTVTLPGTGLWVPISGVVHQYKAASDGASGLKVELSLGGSGLGSDTLFFDEFQLVHAGHLDVTKLGAQASETDTGIAGAALVVKTGVLGSESDTGVVGSPVVTVQGALATETDTGVAGSSSTSSGGTTVTGSLASETDTGITGADLVVATGTSSSESDTGVVGVVLAVVAGALASETDASVAGVAITSEPGTLASETDTGATGTVLAKTSGSLANEVDSAATATDITASGSAASETDSGSPGSLVLLITGTRVTETDSISIGFILITEPGVQSTETDSTNAGGFALIGIFAGEVDTGALGDVLAVVDGSLASDPQVEIPGLTVIRLPGGQTTVVETVSAGELAARVSGVFATEQDSGFTGTTVGGAELGAVFAVGIAGRTFVIRVVKPDFAITSESLNQTATMATTRYGIETDTVTTDLELI